MPCYKLQAHEETQVPVGWALFCFVLLVSLCSPGHLTSDCRIFFLSDSQGFRMGMAHLCFLVEEFRPRPCTLLCQHVQVKSLCGRLVSQEPHTTLKTLVAGPFRQKAVLSSDGSKS